MHKHTDISKELLFSHAIKMLEDLTSLELPTYGDILSNQFRGSLNNFQSKNAKETKLNKECNS